MKSYYKELKSPATVTPWHELTRASPCELERKFDYVRSAHRRLAEAEALLQRVKKLPETERHPVAVTNLALTRDNRQARLDFSVETLKQHLAYATAVYDGTLDKIRPMRSGRKRTEIKQKDRVKSQKTVNYLNVALDEFLLAAAVAAGSWKRTVCGGGKPCAEYRSGETILKLSTTKTITACKHIIADHTRKPCPGHAGTEKAVQALIAHAKPVIKAVISRSGREDTVAEQLAWIELVETAGRFNPAASNGSRFNTFYTWRARRATQIRSANDCPPGKIRIKGKIIARGTLHVEDGKDDDSALFHPTTFDDDTKLEKEEAVARALNALSSEEQEIAKVYLMGDISLRKLAEDRDCTMYQIRKQVAQITEKLQATLTEFAS